MKHFLLKSTIFVAICFLNHFDCGAVDTVLLLPLSFIPMILAVSLPNEQSAQIIILKSKEEF